VLSKLVELLVEEAPSDRVRARLRVLSSDEGSMVATEAEGLTRDVERGRGSESAETMVSPRARGSPGVGTLGEVGSLWSALYTTAVQPGEHNRLVNP